MTEYPLQVIAGDWLRVGSQKHLVTEARVFPTQEEAYRYFKERTMIPDTISEKWDIRFLRQAREVSFYSKDPSTKIGAVIVKDNHVVGQGYNGFPKGVLDSHERYDDRPTKYKMVVHAEVNACIHAGHAARGGTIYVWPTLGFPPICNECAKVVIQSGIIRVVGLAQDPNIDPEVAARWEESIKFSKLMFGEAGIELTSYPHDLPL